MDPTLPPDDPLAALFSGKRKWPRVPTAVAVRLRGAHGEWAGRALDLSPGGTLIAVDDPAFYDGDANAFDRVADAFPDGMAVTFPADGIARRANIVRITPDEEDGVLLGCEFETALDDAERTQLGFTVAETGVEEALADRLPLRARPQRPLHVLLFDERPDLVGPRHVAPLTGAGEHVLEVALAGSHGDPDAVARALGKDNMRACLSKGREQVWQGHARLVRCWIAEDGTLRLRLLPTPGLTREANRHLQRA